jgi:hypothetical protein
MTNVQRALGLALVLVLAAALPGLAQDDKKKPLSEAALVKLAKSDLEDEVLIALVKKRGVSFHVNDTALRRLRNAGVSEAVLTALTPAADDDKGSAAPLGDDQSAPDKPLGTGKFQKGLVIDVTAVKRTSDRFLRVSFRIRNPTKERVTHTISGVYFVPEMHYVEAGGKFKFQVVRDERGNYLASHVPGTLTLNPNETAEYWAKFGQPHKGIKHITLYFRQTEPIEDIPVPPAGN